jgi:hypothetical protein
MVKGAKIRQRRRPMPWWVIALVAPVVVAIFLFFFLGVLEPARDKLLGWIGIKHAKEQAVVKVEPSISEKPAVQVSSGSATDSNKSAGERPVGLIVDPDQICSAIKSAPLLQQDEIGKHYIGIQVDWPGEVAIIKRHSNGMAWIVAYWKGKHMRSFEFEVDPDDYPGISVLEDGDVIRAKGTIEWAKLSSIGLRDVTLLEYGRKPVKK